MANGAPSIGGGAAPLVVPIRPEVQRYLADGVTYEPLRQPQYDHAIFTGGVAIAAGSTFFFATPLGQGTGFAGAGAKTILDTNLVLAGQLPANHVFEIWSIHAVIRPRQPAPNAALPATATVAGDLEAIMYGSFFQFNLLTTPRLQIPTYWLPAGAGISGFAALASIGGAGSNTGSVIHATNGDPSPLSSHRLDPWPIVIPPLQGFSVFLFFPAAVTPINTTDVWLVFDGILHRPALP